jgi:hypothetical protein
MIIGLQVGLSYHRTLQKAKKKRKRMENKSRTKYRLRVLLIPYIRGAQLKSDGGPTIFFVMFKGKTYMFISNDVFRQ